MKTFVTGLAAAGLSIGMAAAQTTATTPGAAPLPGTTSPGVTATPTMPMTGPATGTTMGTTGTGTTATGTTPMRPMAGTTMGAGAVTGAPNAGAGAAAAAGNNNQAVATTAANASMPAKGKNSFTMNQARIRIQARGFAQVTNLRKDNDGVWRGKGQKNGVPADVWVDYKGNVGQQ